MWFLHVLYHLIWVTWLISGFKFQAQWPADVHIALFIYSLHYFHLFSSLQWQKPSDHLNAALHNWSYQQIAVSRHQTGAAHCDRSVITNTHGWGPKSTVAKTLTIGDKWDYPQKTQLFNTAVWELRQRWEKVNIFMTHDSSGQACVTEVSLHG